MTEVEFLKVLGSSAELQITAEELLQRLLAIAKNPECYSDEDTQHVAENLRSAIAQLILMAGYLDTSFNDLVCETVSEFASNQPDLYDEFVAKSVL